MIVACSADAVGHEKPVNCLSYLTAEKSYETNTGRAPDHAAIEALLVKVPRGDIAKPEASPWQRYIDASRERDWAIESRAELDNEQRRLELAGKQAPNYRIREKIAFERSQSTFHKWQDAGADLDASLKTYGIGEHESDIFRWFVGIYRERHDVFGSNAPALVFRVAVYERLTMCPP